MGRAEFTPGPYRAGKFGCSVISDSNEGLTIPGAYEKEAFEYYGGYMIAESVSPNNVSLIAASTELFDALNSLVSSVMAHPDYTGEENEEWTDLVELAEKALKKARGAE